MPCAFSAVFNLKSSWMQPQSFVTTGNTTLQYYIYTSSAVVWYWQLLQATVAAATSVKKREPGFIWPRRLESWNGGSRASCEKVVVEFGENTGGPGILLSEEKVLEIKVMEGLSLWDACDVIVARLISSVYSGGYGSLPVCSLMLPKPRYWVQWCISFVVEWVDWMALFPTAHQRLTQHSSSIFATKWCWMSWNSNLVFTFLWEPCETCVVYGGILVQTQNQKKNWYNITKHVHTISKNILKRILGNDGPAVWNVVRAVWKCFCVFWNGCARVL